MRSGDSRGGQAVCIPRAVLSHPLVLAAARALPPAAVTRRAPAPPQTFVLRFPRGLPRSEDTALFERRKLRLTELGLARRTQGVLYILQAAAC